MPPPTPQQKRQQQLEKKEQGLKNHKKYAEKIKNTRIIKYYNTCNCMRVDDVRSLLKFYCPEKMCHKNRKI